MSGKLTGVGARILGTLIQHERAAGAFEMSAVACLPQIIAIAADDPKAASLNDVEDVERCADAAAWWPVIAAVHSRQCTVSGKGTRHHCIACSACSMCWCGNAGRCQGSWRKSACGSGTTRCPSACRHPTLRH